MAQAQLLDIQGLQVSFSTKHGDVQALHEVSFTIRAGETVCLVGESGSGKTVTSKAIMRLIDDENGSITAGSIQLDGTEVTGLPQRTLRSLRGKKLAMVFQEPMAAFDPVFTVGSQIVETIRRHDRRQTAGQAAAKAIRLLQRVGIPEPELRMKQYPGELSGGMLQRAMIAMALSCEPELLIADEPTTALDVTIQAQILQLLQELKDEYNMAVLLITHDLGIAAQIADRIIVMYAGQIVEQAAAPALFAQPYHPYTLGLLQSVTTMESDRTKRLYAIPGSIPSLADLPSGCRFHPRCPYASEKCRRETPPLQEREGREAACWHVDELIGELSGGRNRYTAPKEQPHGGLTGNLLNGGRPSPSILEPAFAGGFVQERSGFGNPPGTETLIELRHVTKHYPFGRRLFAREKKAVQAVDDVSLTIRKGETFGLVGESGSGKSTLGRVLLHLEKPTSGSVLFEGQELASLSPARLRDQRKRMQMIFQDPYGSVDPRWRVGDIIGEPFTVHSDLSAGQKREAVAELLQLVGLDASAYNRYPHEFSGGQRQRIGIARAIALRPSFVLADEAVSALDVSVQAQIINLLQDLRDRLQLTMLFIGHGLQVVRYVSDRIGVMYLGKLVEIAPSERLFRNPAHPYTKALLASVPSPVPHRHQPFTAIQGEIPSPASPPSGCRFRTRCPAATALCAAVAPELQAVGEEHFAACHTPLV